MRKLFFVMLIMAGCHSNPIVTESQHRYQVIGTWKAVQDEPFLKFTLFASLTPIGDSVSGNAVMTFPWGVYELGAVPMTITVQLKCAGIVSDNRCDIDFAMLNGTTMTWDFVGRYSAMFYSDSLMVGTMRFNQNVMPEPFQAVLIRL